MRQHAGGTVCRGIVDVYPAPLPPQVVELKMAEVRRMLGMDFPADEARAHPAGAGIPGRTEAAPTCCA